MTILNHTGAAALQRAQILAALVEANVEGVPESHIKDLGGYHWQNRIVELQRDHTIGTWPAEGETFYFLTSPVERDIERDSSASGGVLLASTDDPSAAVSLNATPRLFEHREPPMSVYEEAA